MNSLILLILIDKGLLLQNELFVKSLRMSFYAATITEIKWYQQAAFGVLLKVVALVVLVVITYFSVGYGASFAKFMYALIINIGIALAASIALKMLFAATDNVYLRAIGTIILIVVAYQVGAAQSGEGFLSAEQLTTAVTEFSVSNLSTIAGAISTNIQGYTQTKMEELAAEQYQFSEAAGERFTEIEEYNEMFAATDFVGQIADLARFDPIQAYITSSVDYMMYNAIEVQFAVSRLYDYNAIVSDFYDNKLRISI